MGFMDSVKGIAGKVGDSVEKGTKSISDSSKRMAEKSKVKKEIAQLESEIEQSFAGIGKHYFEKHCNDSSSEFAQTFKDIVSKRERADKLRILLSSMEDKRPCAQCGAEVVKGQKFCNNCGAKIEPIVVPIIEGYNDGSQDATPSQQAAPAGKFCSNCGAKLDEGQNFCEKCGTKL